MLNCTKKTAKQMDRKLIDVTFYLFLKLRLCQKLRNKVQTNVHGRNASYSQWKQSLRITLERKANYKYKKLKITVTKNEN